MVRVMARISFPARPLGRIWKEWRARGFKTVGAFAAVAILNYAFRFPLKVVEDKALQFVNDDLIGTRWSWLSSTAEIVIPPLINWILPLLAILLAVGFAVAVAVRERRDPIAKPESDSPSQVLTPTVSKEESMKLQILEAGFNVPSPLGDLAASMAFGSGPPFRSRTMYVNAALFVDGGTELIGGVFLNIESKELDEPVSIRAAGFETVELRRSEIMDFKFEIPKKIADAGVSFSLVVTGGDEDYESEMWSYRGLTSSTDETEDALDE